MKRIILIFALSVLTLAACQPTAISPNPVSTTGDTSTPAAMGTSTDVWQALFQRTPVPWTTPLLPQEPTVLDATYVKINPRPATPFPCRHCPDYALEGGLWKLSLDKGTFRLLYTMNGWRSLGSYSVSGDRIYFFNDPNCHLETGVYEWKLEDGSLALTEIDDPCSQGLRASNLIDQPWLSCPPPNVEAMVTDDWRKPAGCDVNRQ